MTSEPVDHARENLPLVRRGVLVPLAFVAGVIVAAGSGWAGERFYDHYRSTTVASTGLDKLGSHERLAAQLDIERQVRALRETQRTQAAFGLLGGLLGVSLAIAGGIAGGTWLSRLVGILVGGGGGAAAGAGLSAVIGPLFFKLQSPESAFQVLFMSHAAIAAGLGAVVGAGLGLAVHRPGALVRGLAGGMFGALVGVFVLETVNSIAFPLMATYEPIPTEAGSRFVLYASLAVCTAVSAAWFVGEHDRGANHASA